MVDRKQLSGAHLGLTAYPSARKAALMPSPAPDPRVVTPKEKRPTDALHRVGRRAVVTGAGIAGAAMIGMGSSFAAAAPKRDGWPDWLDVTSAGARATGQHDEAPALTSLLKRIGSNSATVYFPRGRYTIESDLTVPPNVALVVDNGAVVEPAEGVTMRIAGPLLAGPYQVFGGAGRIVGRLGATIALPQWWGAKADGRHDDANAINQAIQAMSEAGGGTVHLLPGTYLLATVTRPAGRNEPRFATLIVPKSHVNIDGEGDVSVLKAADGLNAKDQWNFIYPTDARPDNPLTDVQYRNFKVDGNGEKNLDQAAARWNAIGTNFGARITVEHLTFVNNAGRQCLQFGNNEMPHTVTDLIIRHCRFDTVGGAVAGNNRQTDHSSIYAQADGCLIQSNVLIQPVLDRTNASTAIEVHSSNAIVSGNYIRNYRGGINVVATATDHINVTYADNVILRCEQAGFKFWCNRDRVMDGVRITRNTIEQKGPLPGHPKGVQSTAAPIIAMGVSTPIRSAVIEGNSLSYVGNIDAPDERNNGYGISIGKCHNVQIVDNRIVGTLRSAIAHDGIVPLSDDLQRIEILDNQITDCCRAPGGSDDSHTAVLLTHALKKAARTLRFLRVERNSIVNTGDRPTMTRGFYAALGLSDGTITGNVAIGTTTDLTWHGDSSVARLHVEHIGSGSPEDVVRASAGSRYTNRDTGETCEKSSGDSSAKGWVVRAHATEAPREGRHQVGDIVYNTAPKPGSPTGWICVKAGKPGSFAAFGRIDA